MKLKIFQRLILILGAILSVISILQEESSRGIAFPISAGLLYIALGRTIGTISINIYQRVVLVLGSVVYFMVISTTPLYTERILYRSPWNTRSSNLTEFIIRSIILLVAIGLVFFALKTRKKDTQ